MDGATLRKLSGWRTSIFWWASILLFGWGLSSVLSEYRWYFPPDFESSGFLSSRRASFRGAYQWAFYVHIVSGPVAIVLAGILLVSGGIKRYRRTHRLLGRILVTVVILGLLPSGLVMSTQAFTGPIAGWGFVALAIVTATCTIVAINYAINKRFDLHRQWAIRSFILLCSPLLLRFVSSALTGLEVESDWAYRLNAWLSWMLPILIFEVWRKRSNQQRPLPLNPESSAGKDRTIFRHAND